MPDTYYDWENDPEAMTSQLERAYGKPFAKTVTAGDQGQKKPKKTSGKEQANKQPAPIQAE